MKPKHDRRNKAVYAKSRSGRLDQIHFLGRFLSPAMEPVNPKKKKKMSRHIPWEIVVDILSRLPVRSLLRFRCVSTSWLRLIDSSDFVKSHLNRAVENNTNHLFLVLTDDRDRLLAADLDSLTNNNNNYGLFCGSSNGLVCLKVGYASDHHYLVLWNPSTRKSRKLPSSKLRSPVDDYPVKTEYGFGYDSVNDDYKVVRIVLPTDDVAHYGRVDELIEVEAYSLKSNSWHKVEKPPLGGAISLSRLDLSNGAKLAGGAIHWPEYVEHGYYKIGNIVAFDLATEEFRLVPLPGHPGAENPLSVDSFSGYLSVICRNLDVWVMKDYKVKESWTKLVSFDALEDVIGHCRLLACSKDCREILVRYIFSGELFWCSLLGEKIVETVSVADINYVCDMDNVRDAKTCLGSLVPIR